MNYQKYSKITQGKSIRRIRRVVGDVLKTCEVPGKGEKNEAHNCGNATRFNELNFVGGIISIFQK